MPVIQIQSLPFEAETELGEITEKIAQDFSEIAGFTPSHVTVTWSFFPAGGVAYNGQSAQFQSLESHPVQVEVITPDFYTDKRLGEVLSVVATCISKHSGVLTSNLFISHRPVASGGVFERGEVVRWDISKK